LKRIRRKNQAVPILTARMTISPSPALAERVMRAKALPRGVNIEQVCDQSFEGLANIVDVYVRHLRAEVDDPHPDKLIRTACRSRCAREPARLCPSSPTPSLAFPAEALSHVLKRSTASTIHVRTNRAGRAWGCRSSRRSALRTVRKVEVASTPAAGCTFCIRQPLVHVPADRDRPRALAAGRC
jgi:hypothetical protein